MPCLKGTFLRQIKTDRRQVTRVYAPAQRTPFCLMLPYPSLIIQEVVYNMSFPRLSKKGIPNDSTKTLSSKASDDKLAYGDINAGQAA